MKLQGSVVVLLLDYRYCYRHSRWMSVSYDACKGDIVEVRVLFTLSKSCSHENIRLAVIVILWWWFDHTNKANGECIVEVQADHEAGQVEKKHCTSSLGEDPDSIPCEIKIESLIYVLKLVIVKVRETQSQSVDKLYGNIIYMQSAMMAEGWLY